MNAIDLNFVSIVVEGDEDVELILENRHIYVQIKYREYSLAWNDIAGAIARFETLRAEHAKGRRSGEPTFIVISSAAPNGPLAERVSSADWPADVHVIWPGKESDLPIPAAPASLPAAVETASEKAAEIPFATLAPETLVLKLCAVVMLAATGERPSLNHTFAIDELPTLFEQLVQQLQDLPAPPNPYRPQHDEPILVSDRRVRLITGYSGAGKTSWASQAAQQAVGPLVYMDVADTPGPALAHAMSRELAGRLAQQGGQLRKALVAGSAANAILQSLSRFLVENDIVATVVLDNAHRLPADDLVAAIQH